MKPFFLILFLFALSGQAIAENPAAASSFRPPQTEAEKALDRILAVDRKNKDLYNFLLKRAWYKKEKEREFSTLFTKQLRDTWVGADRKLAKEICGPDFDAERGMCGMDYSPVSCEQESNDAYLYRTVHSNSREVVVTYAWPDNPKDGPLYRLINDQGLWKLDGVKCSKDEGHDRDFNYTKKTLLP